MGMMYHLCLCKIDCIVAVRHLSLQQGMKRACVEPAISDCGPGTDLGYTP